jgi:HopA1 effector protein family
MLNSLIEIIDKIEIRQDFTVCHPDYPSFEAPPHIATCLQRTPLELQRKYFITQIQNYLHSIYFSHSLMSLKEIIEKDRAPFKVKNNVINGVDVDFCQQLQQSNTSNGYIDPDWQVVSKTDNDELIVVKDGLHLHINPQQHLPKDLRKPVIGDVVPIYLPNNLVGSDTYITVGDLGIPNREQSVQLYFNFTPNAAISITKEFTQALNQLKIPFQFAILHNPTLFYRYDTGSLWLSRSSYLAIQTLLQKTYQVHEPEFSPNVPLFSKQLVPGLGIAEVPTTIGTFGEQRCELLATGLLIATEQGKTLAADKLDIICQALSAAEINCLRPYLNPSMPDCYGVYEFE